MRLSSKQLLIVGNPFAAPLSAEGRCTALCAVDPNEPMGAQYIGARTVARRHPDPKRRSMLAVGGKTLGRDKVSVVYDLAPVRVADTAYYRNAIKAGDALLAGDSDARIFGLYGQIAALDARKQPEDKAIVSAREKLVSEVAEMGITPALGNLVSLARASLAAFEAEGGDRAAALAAWREQGLAAVANAIDPPQPDAAPLTPRNVEPASAGEGAVQ